MKPGWRVLKPTERTSLEGFRCFRCGGYYDAHVTADVPAINWNPTQKLLEYRSKKCCTVPGYYTVRGYVGK